MSSQYQSPEAGPGVADELTPEERTQASQLLNRIGHAWWLVLILGSVSLIAGIIIFVRPFAAVRVAAIILGIWLLLSGILQLIQSFDRELDTVARVLSAMSGVIGIILGIVCFDSVQDRLAVLVLFIGLWWIIRGVMQLVVGSSVEGGSGFLILLGFLGIMAGIVVLVWNIATLAVLAVVVGIWLMALGIVEIVASLRIRSIHKQAESLAAS